MKRQSALPILALLSIWVAFALYVWLSADRLPARVATHFGASGRPNDWMTREGHVWFTIIAGFVVPGFLLGIFALMRKGPDLLNIPNKEYWLAPDRREETFDFIQRQGIWFAVLFIAFLAGVHHSIVAANGRSPVTLPGSDVAWLAGAFLVAVVIWVLSFFGYFHRKPA